MIKRFHSESNSYKGEEHPNDSLDDEIKPSWLPYGNPINYKKIYILK